MIFYYQHREIIYSLYRGIVFDLKVCHARKFFKCLQIMEVKPQIFFLNLLIDLWLCWVFIAVCRLSLFTVHGLLIAVASLVVEYRL